MKIDLTEPLDLAVVYESYLAQDDFANKQGELNAYLAWNYGDDSELMNRATNSWLMFLGQFECSVQDSLQFIYDVAYNHVWRRHAEAYRTT